METLCVSRRKQERAACARVLCACACACACVRACVCVAPVCARVCARLSERGRHGHITTRLVCKHIGASSLCLSRDSVPLLGLN